MLAWLRPELSTTQDKNFLRVLGPVVGEDMLFKTTPCPPLPTQSTICPPGGGGGQSKARPECSLRITFNIDTDRSVYFDFMEALVGFMGFGLA